MEAATKGFMDALERDRSIQKTIKNKINLCKTPLSNRIKGLPSFSEFSIYNSDLQW